MNRHDVVIEILAHLRQLRDCILQIRDCLLTENDGQEGGREPSLADQKLLDVEQVLRVLRISRSSYYRFVKEGKLQPRKVGGRHCYYLSDLDKMIEESKRRGRF